MKVKVKAVWRTVEEHEAVIEVEVPDGVDPEEWLGENEWEALGDGVLADHEDDESYQSTPDRILQEWDIEGGEE